MDVCMAVYWGRVNDDMFETFLNTFRKVNKTALLQVYTDDIPENMNNYGVEWRVVPRDEIVGKRCLCKMKCVEDCVHQLQNGDRLLVSDVDVYFLDDPFTAFDKLDFDVGVTRRLHSYKFPVNVGIFYVLINPETRNLFGEDFWKHADKHPDEWDWFVDQTYACFLWETGRATDVGWEYNFCPNTDVFGIKLASDMVRRAYESKAVKTLHLKSELKLSLYDGFLEDAVTKHCSGKWNWKKDGA